MKLQIFSYECKNCNNVYKSPQLISEPYGEFLLRTKTGYIKYLFAIDSKVFYEVHNILKLHPGIQRMKVMNQAKVLHHIFGITCDKAADGATYNIDQRPICPHCNQVNIGKWGPVTPPEYVEKNIENVTHKHWNTLNAEEKKILIDKEIQKFLMSSSQNS